MSTRPAQTVIHQRTVNSMRFLTCRWTAHTELPQVWMCVCAHGAMDWCSVQGFPHHTPCYRIGHTLTRRKLKMNEWLMLAVQMLPLKWNTGKTWYLELPKITTLPLTLQYTVSSIICTCLFRTIFNWSSKAYTPFFSLCLESARN